MSIEDHTFIFTQDFLSDGYGAECDCGWEHRDTFDTKAEALDAWENHCEQIFMEATGG